MTNLISATECLARLRQEKLCKQRDEEYEKMLNNFILDTSMGQQSYMNNIDRFVQQKHQAYSQKMEDYQVMIQYQKLIKNPESEESCID